MLKCFTNDLDYVIAESNEDAWMVWQEHTGDRPSVCDYTDWGWREVNILSSLNVDGEIKEVYKLIAERRRGYLCGTEV